MFAFAPTAPAAPIPTIVSASAPGGQFISIASHGRDVGCMAPFRAPFSSLNEPFARRDRCQLTSVDSRDRDTFRSAQVQLPDRSIGSQPAHSLFGMSHRLSTEQAGITTSPAFRRVAFQTTAEGLMALHFQLRAHDWSISIDHRAIRYAELSAWKQFRLLISLMHERCAIKHFGQLFGGRFAWINRVKAEGKTDFWNQTFVVRLPRRLEGHSWKLRKGVYLEVLKALRALDIRPRQKESPEDSTLPFGIPLPITPIATCLNISQNEAVALIVSQATFFTEVMLLSAEATISFNAHRISGEIFLGPWKVQALWGRAR